ncbi:MAG TPA: hypothetical protein VE291_12955 [Terracidiphilus sp.]|jgi:hypothetical protein|nr:hypothetical protein [Terracidiphilus sp.]
MEATCIRCHQTVVEGNTFCPACGLPQLVYNADSGAAQGQAERGAGAPRDASVVDWKPAMRAAFLLAIPAGLLSNVFSPVSALGVFFVAGAAAWAVAWYVRGSEGTAWITIGAGARIGLVTGLMAAWLAFGVSGGALFVQRYMLHNVGQTDQAYRDYVSRAFEDAVRQSMSQVAAGDAAQVHAAMVQMESMFLSPWGRAASMGVGLTVYSTLLLFFAVGGGALGARMLARLRPPPL